MNSECGSGQRTSGIESDVWFRRLWRSVSQRRKPRETESVRNRSFTPSNVDSKCKGDKGTGMKGGHKEGTQKQKVRKVHFVALMDIHQIQKYEYIPGNVGKSNLKCGSNLYIEKFSR